jgi:hypothetical protein
VRLSIYSGASRLVLPVRRPKEIDKNLKRFQESEGAPAVVVSQVQPKKHAWRVVRDLGRDEATLEVVKDEGALCLEDIDWTVSARAREWYSYQGDDFDSLRGETLWERSFQRGAWSVQTTTRTVLTSTADVFRIHAELDAFIRDERVFARNWDYEIPRDHV